MEEITVNNKTYLVEDVIDEDGLKDSDLLWVIHWNTVHSYLFTKNYKHGFLWNMGCKMKKIIKEI